MRQHPVGEIASNRLILIPVTTETLLSEKAGDGRLAQLIDCTVPANWPPADWEPHVFEILLVQFAADAKQIGRHRYLALVQPDGTRLLIGCAGAFWRPEAPAVCEIGYTVLPPHEGRGLATEATRRLIELLREDHSLTSVVAHTFPRLIGSIRVLEKCGFAADGAGAEPGTLRFRLSL